MSKDIRKIAVLSCSAVMAYALYKEISKKTPAKYSLEQIRGLSRSQWETEREAVRKKLNSPEYSDSLKIGFKKVLELFDRVRSEQDWEGKIPHGPAYSREHGYNLYKP